MSIAFNADEVFEMGMDIERSGEAFYRKAAELAKDPRVKEVLTKLMREERKHYGIFKKWRESLEPKSSMPTVVDPEGQQSLYLEALVKSRLFGNEKEAEEVAAKVASGVEALKAALAFEKDTILFFEAMKGMTREDLGRGDIDKLIAEECRHVAQIGRAIREAEE